jgi:hypothetical protein
MEIFYKKNLEKKKNNNKKWDKTFISKQTRTTHKLYRYKSLNAKLMELCTYNKMEWTIIPKENNKNTSYNIRL